MNSEKVKIYIGFVGFIIAILGVMIVPEWWRIIPACVGAALNGWALSHLE